MRTLYVSNRMNDMMECCCGFMCICKTMVIKSARYDT